MGLWGSAGASTASLMGGNQVIRWVGGLPEDTGEEPPELLTDDVRIPSLCASVMVSISLPLTPDTLTLILKDCPHILGFPCIPSSDGRLIPSHSSRLFGVTFCNIYLTLGGKISLFIRASVIRLGPLEKVQENIFIVWPIIISGVSLLPSNVADLHSPEIIEYRLWSAIG